MVGLAPPSTTTNRETADWSFARRPFWLFSHLFAAVVIVTFVLLGLWQLDRLDQRQARNDVVEARAFAPPVAVATALDRPADELDFVAVADTGRYLDPELVRVANRSQGGQAGDWVVGLFETDDGVTLLVNRGFIPRNAEASDPTPPDRVTGWLRESVERGSFGATDDGTSQRVPRLDVDAIAGRAPDLELAPVWLQLDGSSSTGGATLPDYPVAVPLPELSDGPHLGYALQWFTFAVLGVIVYGLLLRKTARSTGSATGVASPTGPETNTGEPSPGE